MVHKLSLNENLVRDKVVKIVSYSTDEMNAANTSVFGSLSSMVARVRKKSHSLMTTYFRWNERL